LEPNFDVINGSTINTLPNAIFLRKQKDKNKTRTKALTNVPMV
jgi:hypothetical protein